MKLKSAFFWFTDLVIIAIAALLPGIRGYENWNWIEYLVLILMLVYILYMRHKKSANSSTNQYKL